ncbi:MAG: virulence factor SrfC family protein [Roseovarius sp.]|nr:virulence factor SrfC family protein [Roseovarius sp.]
MTNSRSAISRIEEWVYDPRANGILGAHQTAVKAQLPGYAVDYQLMERQSGARPTVAVFGPSQVGKSYLMAKICENENQVVEVGIDRNYNFLTEINPSGGRESTALVTRMTTDAYLDKCPSGYVSAKLLSLPELVAVFANIHVNDLKPTDTIGRDFVIARLQDVIDDNVADYTGPTDPEMTYLQKTLTYLPVDFGHFKSVFRLKPGLVDKLNNKQKARLFSMFWGDASQLTGLFEHLCENLEKLRFSSEVYISADGLVPRDNSIIDVSALSMLQKDVSIHTSTASVMLPDGTNLQMDRSVMCALISEIRLNLVKPRNDLLNKVDILDFPGARGRARRDISQYDEEGAGRLFLRGKISHLFESAAIRDEIDCLLLCVKPGPMDVTNLPDTVDRWVKGISPEHINSRLLFLATKFDLHFPDAAGQEKNDRERFDNAIFSALLEPFSPTDGSWVSKMKFKNVFPLRNPNYPYDGFFLYENGVEVKLREDSAERINSLREAFVTSDNLVNTMHDPDGKWVSLMTPGDGGAHYLIDKMNEIHWMRLKRERLQHKRSAMLESLYSLMEPFADHDDPEKQLSKETKVFKKHFLDLQALLVRNCLSEFANVFMVKSSHLKAQTSTIMLEAPEQDKREELVRGVLVPPLLGPVFAGENKVDPLSRKEQFTDKLVDSLTAAWILEIGNNISGWPAAKFSNQKPLMEYIASQLTTEAQIVKIKNGLRMKIQNWGFGLKLTDNLEPICMLAELTFNDHMIGKFSAASDAVEIVKNSDTVNELPTNLSKAGSVDFFNRWMKYISDVIKENTTGLSVRGGDPVMNSSLIEILQDMQSTMSVDTS